jgi:hypothetical protein
MRLPAPSRTFHLVHPHPSPTRDKVRVVPSECKQNRPKSRRPRRYAYPSNCSENDEPSGCWPIRATIVVPSSITSRPWERSRSCLPNPTANNNEPTTKNSIESAIASNDASPGSSTSAAAPHDTKNQTELQSPRRPCLLLATPAAICYMSTLPRNAINECTRRLAAEAWDRHPEHADMNIPDPNPKPGDWGNLLLQIWPVDPRSLMWPPKETFTNGGPKSIATLLGRWRMGEEVPLGMLR